MDRDQISHTQLTALVWAAVLAPAAELLPSLTLPLAGKGAWLSPLAAAPLVLLAGWCLGRLSGAEGLAQSLARWPGKWAGGAVLLIYMVWGELLLSLRLRLCAQRLLSSGYQDGTVWFFLAAVAAMTLWMGMGHLGAFARAGQLFLAVLLAAGGTVLLLSLFQTDPRRVLPLWTDDLGPILTSGVPAAGVLGWGLYGAFLTGQVRPRENRGRWYWPFWGAGGCVLLCLGQWIILGCLGPALSARLDNPFFALAKSVGVEGAFQRVESVIAALWTLADLAMAVLLLFAMRAAGGVLLPKAGRRPLVGCALILGAVGALLLLPQGRAELLSRELVPWGNLVLGLGLPLALLLLRRICEKKQ